ncbi:VWA domain-containing protein [Mycoplasmatota bacterium]|nr:VWA domain-containing protein [Mycoplasmatota bacterium]
MKKILTVVMVASLFLLASCSGSMDYDNGYYENYSYEPSAEGETYEEIVENEYINTADMPVSTFSTDVDTASYANVRRMINNGSLPNVDAVRIEEMINYFDYDIEGPSDDEVIKVSTELSDTPWHENHQLMMVGLKSQDIIFEETEGMNLVFLIDVSGSMSSTDKLPLLKEAFGVLIDQLRPSDSISIVVYAGAAGVVLEGADDEDEIRDALNHLTAGGSTAGSEGIELAYEIAERHFIEGGNNRIIMATDGDFNAGISDVDTLEEFIAEKRDTGVFFSILGFGTGNINDEIMEKLTNSGNGIYFYIDSLKEAEKVFEHELSGSIITVAKDVKLQIEFNSEFVKAYRLIGYDNRMLNYEDFEDDDKDAGDVGSGHTVIAFYELILNDSSEEVDSQEFDIPDELRYDGENYLDEYANVSIRYKTPDGDVSVLIEHQVLASDYTDSPSESFVFASNVVEFGLILRDSAYKGQANYNHVLESAEDVLGEDEFGYRAEFLMLVGLAKELAA